MMTQPSPTNKSFASHIYVVGFSDGIVKVGRTSNPRRRMTTLGSMAHRRGAEITHRLMGEHENADWAEWSMKQIGATSFKPAWGKEHFHADFDEFLDVLELRLPQFGITFTSVIPRDPAAEAETLSRFMVPALSGGDSS